MMILEDLKHEMSVRNISRISGISLSGYYYKPKERHIQRLDPSIKDRIKDIASERPTYGYRRVWAVLRNSGTEVNQKTVRNVLKDSNMNLPASKHRGRTKKRNLLKPTGPDQLWETDITYIRTESGMTYLFNIKDCFTKEWMGYFYSRTCNRKDALKSIENSVMIHPDRYPDAMVDGINLRSDNGDQYTSSYFKEHVKAMGFIQEFIEKSTPEQDGDIESFHMSLKTDYIWVREIKDFSECERIIENAFSDYNNVRPHSSIEYLAPTVFRERYLYDAGFRSMYDEKLENRRNKKRERNKMSLRREK